MVLLNVTADTWLVTGLGFGIVLILLFCLVYILQTLGWIMQKITAPKTTKTDKTEEKKSNNAVSPKQTEPAVPTDEGTKAAIAMALSQAGDEDQVAIAMALYLYKGTSHDIPTAMIKPQARNTAWNIKSYGLNNVGF